jgi:predicted MFS family arabinose efflux permease
MRRRLEELARPLRAPDLRKVWCAQALSEFGDWAARIALAVLVLDRTDSVAVTGLVFAVAVAPSLGLGPLLATIGDRHPRRSVMIAADLVRCVLGVAMALPIPIWLVFVLLFASAAATAPFEAARSALIPDMVPPEQYHDALVVRSITDQVALLLGYAAGGGLTAVLGPRGALLANASTFLLSAVLVARVAAGRDRPAVAPRAVESLRAGLAAILSDPRVRLVAACCCVISGVTMAAESLAVAYADEVLGRGDGGQAGVLAAAVPVGTILVSTLVPFRPDARRAVARIGAVGVSTAAAGAALFAVDLDVPWVLLAFVAVGGVFATGIYANTIFGAALPAASRASSFGVLQALFTATQALGAVFGGVGAELVGVRETCVAALATSGVVALGLFALGGAPLRAARDQGHDFAPTVDS